MTKMSETKTVLLVGVGGQGILLVSKVISLALVAMGWDVKMSEVHGMAQRGGCVSTQVRYGTKVYSPFVGRAAAEILLGFEIMEAYRFLPYMKSEGIVIFGEVEIPSAPVFSGKKKYPTGIAEEIEKNRKSLKVPVLQIAKQIGSSQVENTILLGILAYHTGTRYNLVEEILVESVKEPSREKNRIALQKGYEFARSGSL